MQTHRNNAFQTSIFTTLNFFERNMCVCMELIHVDTCKRTLRNTRLSKNGEALSCFAPLDMRPSLLKKINKQQTLLYR